MSQDDVFSMLDNQNDFSGQVQSDPQLTDATNSNTNILGGSDDDDLFNPPQTSSQPPLQPPTQPHEHGEMNHIDDMLANDDDDDDLFSNNNTNNNASNPNQPPAEPETPSALIEWEAKKKEELAVLDKEESEKNEELRKEGKAASDKFYDGLRDAQAKRAKHNLEVDEQTKADLESTNENVWEKTVSYIDFNRTDLHERDVSRMKTLLLQMKNAKH